MAFFPSPVLWDTQHLQESAMPDRMAMYKLPAASEDDFGGEPNVTYPDNYVTVESNVRCRFVSNDRMASEEGGAQVQVDFDGFIVKPISSAEPKPHYRIRRTARDGIITDYEVIGEQDSSDKSAIHAQVKKVVDGTSNG